ncbi:MAG: CbtA family protein, partial [Rhodospirillales bacterium]|nr:CbtA family protein [Rhodospirillales bacterium]
MFARIILTAVFAGLIAGVFAWGAHMVKTTPLILAAEVYENAAQAAAPQHTHATAMPEPQAWEPADGLERNLFTLIADVVAGIGFAFMLAGAIALSGRKVDARLGMAWGLAGFAAFFAAPSLGLAPELPGMQAAGLGARQAW